MPYNDGVTISELLDDYLTPQGKGAAAAASRALEVREATVSRWRHGTDVPTDIRAGALAGLLGLTEEQVTMAIVAERRKAQTARSDGVMDTSKVTVTPLPPDGDELDDLESRLETIETAVRELRREVQERRAAVDGTQLPGDQQAQS